MEVKLEDPNRCALEKAQDREAEQVWECPGSCGEEAAIIAHAAHRLPRVFVFLFHRERKPRRRLWEVGRGGGGEVTGIAKHILSLLEQS